MSLAAQYPPRPQQSLTVLTAPTATDLLLAETVRDDLGLDSDDATLRKLARIVSRASGLVAGYLRYDPAYSPAVVESFWNFRGANLYVSKRPLLAVSQILDGASVALATTNFAVDLIAHSIIRVAGWGTWGYSLPVGHIALIDGSLNLPDWRVTYAAGWWLETMTGDRPDGVPTLPPAVEGDFLAICRWLWWRSSGAQDAGIASMSQEGASVTYRAPKDEEVDKETGLPRSLTVGMRPYRRVA